MLPPLNDAMRAVLRNEKGAYQSEDELYAALCQAAPQDKSQTEEDYARLVDRLGSLLSGVAIALKGPEKPLHRHGWQDLPELAAKVMAELQSYRQQGGGDADFEIRQDGMPVAATSGPRERSLADAQHYAMMYSADGPVDLVEIVKIAHIDAARAQRAGKEA